MNDKTTTSAHVHALAKNSRLISAVSLDEDSGERDILMLRGHKVQTDRDGNFCLDDIFALSNARDTKEPKQWRRISSVKRLIAEVEKKVSVPHLKGNNEAKSVIYAKSGRGNKGTFAHPVLAAAYAGYLSPKLEIEVREVWLRYRSGDAKLADEILARASTEDNEWAGARALGRAERKKFAGILKEHGVAGIGYAQCTDATYETLFDLNARQMKARKQIAAKANLRDSMDTTELALTMISEQLAGERITDEHRHGNRDCRDATVKSASRIRAAVEADRADRQPRTRL